MRDVVLPPDLPLDVIAEEVQKSWRAKEVHVEALIQNVGTAMWYCLGIAVVLPCGTAVVLKLALAWYYMCTAFRFCLPAVPCQPASGARGAAALWGDDGLGKVQRRCWQGLLPLPLLSRF